MQNKGIKYLIKDLKSSYNLEKIKHLYNSYYMIGTRKI